MIHLLPQDLINKIAAGEVVERPASVVKELVENALDSGADRIEVKVEDGGAKLIQIVDNGSGMNEEDARQCLLRHATSKISSVDDLFNIHTMGFRGEALASIASVSEFSLVTKTLDAVQANKVWLDEKQQVQLEPAAANQGTTVTVRNLFHNVPARKKFLKTAQTEMTHILRYLQQCALANPEIEMKADHNGKTLFHYQQSDWEKRVENVLGKEFAGQLISLNQEAPGLSITGFVAKPAFVHATHKNQYLFVNGRPVYDHLVSRSVLEAYDTMIPRGYYPAFVLRIDMDPSQVDVNVHPRKSEVKFVDPGQIIRTLKTLVSSSLNQADLVQEKAIPASAPTRFATMPRSSSSPMPKPMALEKKPLLVQQSFAQGISTLQRSPLEEKGWKVLAQIHLSFILVETQDGLQVFDQHAVSEITNYQRLVREKENGEICSQQLLIPVDFEVSPEEASILEENMALLQKMGWEIDELTPTSIQISSLPEILKIEKIQETVHELLSELKEGKDLDMSKREWELLKFEACRGAVMFGDALSLSEMEGLLNQWIKVPNNAACEHGRPAMAKITVDEMRKYFKR